MKGFLIRSIAVAVLFSLLPMKAVAQSDEDLPLESLEMAEEVAPKTMYHCQWGGYPEQSFEDHTDCCFHVGGIPNSISPRNVCCILPVEKFQAFEECRKARSFAPGWRFQMVPPSQR